MVKSTLDKLRKPGRGKSIVAYIMFAAIIMVFAFFFQTGPLSSLSGGGAAAVVNNQVIPISEYKIRVRRQEEQLRMRLGDLPDSQRQLFYDSIRRRALEDLISAEVLAQSAAEAGFLASDAEVRDRILEIPAFQEEGRFRRDRYEDLLRSNRMTTNEFEEKVRKDVMGQKVQETFSKALYPVEAELEREKRLRQMQINLAFVEFDRRTLADGLNPSDAEATTFLGGEEGLKAAQAYYDENKEEYTSKEEVKAQHILIKSKMDDKASEEAALTKIKEIAERSKTEDFGKLAAELSEDDGSKAKQGDLGYFAKGRMVKEFEQVAFSTPVGTISEPVKSPFGYHLIKVNDHKQGGVKEFDQVKIAAAKKVLADGQVKATVEKIESLVKEGSQSSLESLVKKLSLKWDETGEFSLGAPTVPKLGDKEKILNAALKINKPGALVPELLEVGGKYYLVKVKAMGTKKEDESEELSFADQARFHSFRKTGPVFEDWLRGRREKAQVTMNGQLLGQQE